ncbi:unnamed protein product [Brassica oleracea]
MIPCHRLCQQKNVTSWRQSRECISFAELEHHAILATGNWNKRAS